MRRLVLGCGTMCHTVVDTIATWSGTLRVIAGDARSAETLRDDGIPAEHADPTDPAILRQFELADVVFVAGDDSRTNLAAVEAAREAHPRAHVVAYTGREPEPDVREAIEATADSTVNRERALVEAFLDDLDAEVGERIRNLSRTLRSIDGRLGVFMHDNPDPDAIGSALALRDLAGAHGTEADVCYFGEISHQENRALVNLLDLDLRQLDHDEFDPSEYAAIALVDHSRPGINDQLPEETDVAIVIDHHPPREAVSADFVDLRRSVGATSTLLADYCRRYRLTPSSTVATALLFGIRVDTNDFEREATETDFEAAAYLLPHAETDVLERIENPQVTPDTLDTLGRAIRNRKRKDSVLISGVGRITDRDAIAQAADQLLDIEDVTTTLVYGFDGETVFASARSRGSDLDIGETMRQAYGRIGEAGGHTDMAGAQLSLGILADVEPDDPTEIEGVIAEVMTNRFFEVVGLRRVLDAPDIEMDPV